MDKLERQVEYLPDDYVYPRAYLFTVDLERLAFVVVDEHGRAVAEDGVASSHPREFVVVDDTREARARARDAAFALAVKLNGLR